MKKFLPLLLIFVMIVWLGCGDDGPTDPVIEPDLRISVNTTAGDPGMTSVNSAVWNNVDTMRVEVFRSGLNSLLPAKLSVVAASALVQVLVNNDDLFLRIQWEDTSFNAWREHYYVSDDTSGFVQIDRKAVVEQAEDQLYILFKNPDTNSTIWDAWNWRVLTTGAGGFAEGFNYSSIDSLSLDSAGTKVVKIGWENPSRSGEPTYVHQDTSEFNGYILYLDEKLNRGEPVGVLSIDNFTDPNNPDTTWYDWPRTKGWTLNQKIPGWMIDGDAKDLSEAQLGSRWDIRAIDEYDETNDIYTVVLKRKLNTGYDDDFNMAIADSIKTKIVILNNKVELYEGDTWRGVSENLWLIF
ncbi:MAG: hypothetical protein U9N54_08015 [candidate division Zixibacteria bacterium]|nr:hypothetical protein [candidate division Zixibacteria bacterium]